MVGLFDCCVRLLGVVFGFAIGWWAAWLLVGGGFWHWCALLLRIWFYGVVGLVFAVIGYVCLA